MKPEPKHLIFSADLRESARAYVPCTGCGAPAGQPCKDTTFVHDPRRDLYIAWLKAYHAYYREGSEVELAAHAFAQGPNRHAA